MFVHRNNDVIIDAKTLSRTRRLMLFSCRQKGTVHKNCSYFKVTRTRLQNPYMLQMLLELLFIRSGAFDSFSVSDVKVLIDGLCTC